MVQMAQQGGEGLGCSDVWVYLIVDHGVAFPHQVCRNYQVNLVDRGSLT